MQRNFNIVGQNVAKFRRQQGWTREELVAKLQLIGCCMTLDILARIETQRCTVIDAQVVFFSQVFCVSVEELFPSGPDID